ncbi:hypothetical protein [Marinobacterium aestuarii]|uniref:hypothetical protein n=1 Tax=Marinobacterium aestuarii TaxID=1821621 RepID=UPI0012FFC5A6|nr:hypothetical protein [Marinobacterium aestuarii]
MRGNALDANLLSSKLINDGFVEVCFSISKGYLLDHMIKTDLRLAYATGDGFLVRNILLAKGFVFILCGSLFMSDVTEVFDFYVMNRSNINIHKGRAKNGNSRFTFFLK